ncbi:hypothetical protein QCA50_020598 [Cerrena zonata]|uniref:Uncharacterized protein n=1 Tax=Cerrena zonata TaxID=2478898 RepID=A0AAW0F7Y0_9APHY
MSTESNESINKCQSLFESDLKVFLDNITITICLIISIISLGPGTEHPPLAIILPAPQTDFVLDLKTTSLTGNKAKLVYVPKLHELITYQVSTVSLLELANPDLSSKIKKVIVDKGTWKIALSGLASVQDIKEDIKKQQHVYN